MSALNNSPLLGASGSQGYFLNRSLRFRASASAWLNRTPASLGNQHTWTWSCWVKRGTIGPQIIYNTAGSINSNSALAQIYFDNNNKLNFFQYNVSTTYTTIATTQVFRDFSSWYHIVIAYDDPQATASNRVKIYVNGVQVTAFDTATYPTQNFNGYFNLTQPHSYARDIESLPITYFDGYLAEINFIDGQALTPTSFGAYNATTGVWQPIKYTGTYGTQGYYLNFQDNSAATAAAIGKDSSGNGNNWTPNNISVTAGTTYDSMTDVPTLTSPTQANFPVLNAVSAYSGLPISSANLQTTAVASGANWFSRSTTMAFSSGKIYAEFSMPSITSGAQGNPVGFGIMPSSVDFSAIGQQIGGSGYGYGFYCPDTAGTSPKKIVAGTTTAVGTGTATATTDIFMVAFDLTNGNAWFGKNGTWYAGDPSAGTGASITGITAGEYIFGLSVYRDGTYTNNTAAINFGQRPFTYTPPTGFKSLNTYNLPAPTIPNGATQFAATLWTGTGVTRNIDNTVNGVSFQPDLVWLKIRSSADSNGLFDAVRGASKRLQSNDTGAEATTTAVQSAFLSNGFTVGTDVQSNGSGSTYVGWQWKESASSGLDIVLQTLGTTGINTITHNLNVVPKMVIAKRTNGVEQWLVYQSSATTQSQYLGLNTTAAVATSANLWGSSAFTSSQIYFSGTSGNAYVFYIFSEIAGYSKFGSYTGNGSTDGVFVYTGFRPRWVMLKLTSAAGYDWVILDTSRNTYNVMQTGLQANSTAADNSTSSYYIDTLSNGFKLRNAYAGLNGSGSTYIYAAFAENPFNYSLAR